MIKTGAALRDRSVSANQRDHSVADGPASANPGGGSSASSRYRTLNRILQGTFHGKNPDTKLTRMKFTQDFVVVRSTLTRTIPSFFSQLTFEYLFLNLMRLRRESPDLFQFPQINARADGGASRTSKRESPSSQALRSGALPA